MRKIPGLDQQARRKAIHLIACVRRALELPGRAHRDARDRQRSIDRNPLDVSRQHGLQQRIQPAARGQAGALDAIAVHPDRAHVPFGQHHQHRLIAAQRRNLLYHIRIIGLIDEQDQQAGARQILLPAEQLRLRPRRLHQLHETGIAHRAVGCGRGGDADIAGRVRRVAGEHEEQQPRDQAGGDAQHHHALRERAVGARAPHAARQLSRKAKRS